jgi:hypothetical protein
MPTGYEHSQLSSKGSDTDCLIRSCDRTDPGRPNHLIRPPEPTPASTEEYPLKETRHSRRSAKVCSHFTPHRLSGHPAMPQLLPLLIQPPALKPFNPFENSTPEGEHNDWQWGANCTGVPTVFRPPQWEYNKNIQR